MTTQPVSSTQVIETPKTILEILPSEIVQYVLSFLNSQGVASVSCASKKFHQVVMQFERRIQIEKICAFRNAFFNDPLDKKTFSSITKKLENAQSLAELRGNLIEGREIVKSSVKKIPPNLLIQASTFDVPRFWGKITLLSGVYKSLDTVRAIYQNNLANNIPTITWERFSQLFDITDAVRKESPLPTQFIIPIGTTAAVNRLIAGGCPTEATELFEDCFASHINVVHLRHDFIRRCLQYNYYEEAEKHALKFAAFRDQESSSLEIVNYFIRFGSLEKAARIASSLHTFDVRNQTLKIIADVWINKGDENHLMNALNVVKQIPCPQTQSNYLYSIVDKLSEKGLYQRAEEVAMKHIKPSSKRKDLMLRLSQKSPHVANPSKRRKKD